MEAIRSPGPIGVIVARFQEPQLHAGHLHLITHVRERHEDVLIVLGAHGGVRSSHDPLTFEERATMIDQAFPGQRFCVRPLLDHPFSHEKWSVNLDELIKATYPDRDAVLYGSRGSFIPKYTGNFSTSMVASIFAASGTEHRAEVEFPHTRDGRAAAIYVQQHRPSYMYSTSDLAIVREDHVLLIGKNQHDGLLSFVGGHGEKHDGSASGAAIREAHEEVPGVEFGDLIYVDTVVVDDPRYRDAPDGVMTTFYRARYQGGVPSPGDDAHRVEWVPFTDLIERLVPWHRPLGELLVSCCK